MRRASLALVCCAAFAPALSAQGFQLTIGNIMRGPQLVGTSPSDVRFSPDGRTLYFRWRSPGVDTLDQDYRVPVAGGAPERLPRHAVDTIPMGDGVWSPDRTREVVTLKGDLYLVDTKGVTRRLTATTARESNPSWSADGRTVYFTREDNAFALSLDRSWLDQLTDIRRGPAPKKPAADSGQKKFLDDQQKQLFDFIRRQVAAERLAADTDTTGRKPWYLAEGQSVAGIAVSPDGRFASVGVRVRGTGQNTVMPVWVTQSGYVTTESGRVKVGDSEGRARAALVELATGKVTWVDSTAGIKGGARDVETMDISPNSRHALFRVTSDDFKDLWLVVVDLPSLAERVVMHRHDDAWVGETGFLGQGAYVGWLSDGETVYYGSEETGYAHLYTVSAAGGAAKALTSGDWEVQDVTLSPDRKTFLLSTDEGDWGQRHLWALPVNGGARVQLTTAPGQQDVTVSPDGKTIAVLHSTQTHPPELYVQDARAGAPARKLTESTTPEWRSYAWTEPGLIEVTASDGARIPARLYRPAGPANHAAVIFVHGAGYLQDVAKGWSFYYREQMFHQFLAAHGYAVLELDYRGSAGHGRAWRAAIYRHMGGRDLDDQVDGARWLVKNLDVDSARIGIYGGSYGGFMTLMAMFTRPGVFAAGAALRPVTDWAAYNDGYTGRILNRPQDDSVAYQQSSPIYFAAGLAGHLLICHGLVDSNVHFEDTARLTQRLIELGKENWSVAFYPVESHGFVRADSWTDEYRRIYRLFDETIGQGR